MSAGSLEPLGSIGGVDLETFGSLVSGRKYEETLKALCVALRLLRIDGEFTGYAIDDTTRPGHYSRFAAAIGALFRDALLSPAEEGFELFALEGAMLSAVFRASVFENTDHLLREFGIPDPEDSDKN